MDEAELGNGFPPLTLPETAPLMRKSNYPFAYYGNSHSQATSRDPSLEELHLFSAICDVVFLAQPCTHR